jgi:hypothetical protein
MARTWSSEACRGLYVEFCQFEFVGGGFEAVVVQQFALMHLHLALPLAFKILQSQFLRFDGDLLHAGGCPLLFHHGSRRFVVNLGHQLAFGDNVAFFDKQRADAADDFGA